MWIKSGRCDIVVRNDSGRGEVMAAKKYYAVKKGKAVGVFTDWETCRASVEGCPGAEYKGFASLAEAEAYLGRQAVSAAGPQAECRKERKLPEPLFLPETAEPGERPPAGVLLAYVDGSYDHSLKRYAFGCVFILPDGRIRTVFGNGDNEQSLRYRNVTGEMLGAMYAVKTAMANGFSKIEIRYDYQGIEKWVTGEWRSKTELTVKYARAMRQWGQKIAISFTKVAAHSNVYYNELADRTAKTGLREGSGIPKVCILEEQRGRVGENAGDGQGNREGKGEGSDGDSETE